MSFGKLSRLACVAVSVAFGAVPGMAQATAPLDENSLVSMKNSNNGIPEPSTKNRNANLSEVVVQPTEATPVTKTATEPPAPSVKPLYVPHAIEFQHTDKLTQLEKAYLDVFTILSTDNTCSRLYGGTPAIMALNELVKQLKPTYFDRTTGMRMSGVTTNVQHNPTGFTFRLFDKAELNLDGSFFKGNGVSLPHVPTVGGFNPNTREARVALLLHELGHLVKGADKQWVLRDDGGDSEISRSNTRLVVDICGKQIDGLSKLSVAEELRRMTPETGTETARLRQIP